MLKDKLYKYIIAFNLPENFKEPRVFEEQFSVAENLIYSRKEAKVDFHNTLKSSESFGSFSVDRHLVALPLIQEQSETDPVYILKSWLAYMIILAPIPSFMTGKSRGMSGWSKKYHH